MDIRGVYSKDNIDSKEPLSLNEYVINLDDIPFPDYGLIDMEKYTTGNTRQMIKKAICKDEKAVNLITTRGCPFKCIFCSSHTVHGRQIRYRSVENVVREVQYLYESYNVSLFLLEDDLFPANKKRTIDLLKALRDLSIPKFAMQFPNALSINTLDEEILNELILSGMEATRLAIESGSEYVQKNIIKKSVNLNKARKIFKIFEQKKIPVRCLFILGYPHETKEQMRETVEYAKNLGADWNDFSIATPLPGAEMYYEFVRLGYLTNDSYLSATGYFSKRTFDTKEISAKELAEFAYRANLECNFINNRNIAKRNWEEGIRVFEPIVSKYPFHIVGWYCITLCLKAQGKDKEASQIRNKIRCLIETDERAKEMYRRYNDLLPDL